MLRVIEFIKPIYDIKPNGSRTWGEFKKELFKTFPEKLIEQTIKEFNEIQTQDVVLMFYSEESVDEDYDDE